jgi:ferritin-like metal-binding protein YciE
LPAMARPARTRRCWETPRARLLQATLTEETETDQKLTALAKSVINLVATK